MSKKFHVFLLFLIFFLAFLLRFYKLGEIPNGLYQDESAIGYNAYSLLQTGKDEYAKPLPLYFKSFGDYKLPLYIYSTVFSVRLFGLNSFAVRFPSAFFGWLTVVVFYFFVKELIRENSKDLKYLLKIGNLELGLPELASLFLAISPWHLHYNRATFEVSVSLFLFVFAGLLLLMSFRKRTFGYFFLGTLCFVASLYSYNLTRLLSPVLYLLFLVFNKEKIRNISKKEFIFTVFVSFLLLLPFIITFFDKGGVKSAKGTLISTSAIVQGSLLEFRSYLVDLPILFTKLFFNKWLLTFWQYLQNITAFFSSSFFFISGASHGNHGIGNVGQFYLFEFVTILFGIYKILEKKIFWGYFLLAFCGAVIAVVALTRESPHATRSFFLLAPVEAISAFGLIKFFQLAKSFRTSWIKMSTFSFLALFVFYNLVYYFISYYVRFPILYAKSWRFADRDVSLYVKANESKYNKIIFDREAGFIYSSYLFYSGYSPLEFQKTSLRYPDDSEGMSLVRSFDKFEFRDIDASKDFYLPRTLFITTALKKPETVKSLKTFYFPKRPVAFGLRQEIISYPVEEIAYVLVETE